jgi:membrane protein YqaA with SNARE-associated domain
VHKLASTLIAWGPAGALLFSVLDSAGLPLPAGVDAFLIAVAAVDPRAAYWSAALAIIGSTGGNLFLFFVAWKGGERYLQRHTTSSSSSRFVRWFRRYGLLTVFIPALVPIIPLPLKVFVISAGALHVRPLSFILVVLAGRIPRYLAMAYLGEQLGEHSSDWLKEHFWHFVVFALALFVFLYALLKLVERFRKPDRELR